MFVSRSFAALSALPLLFVFSCNDASFTGSAKNRAKLDTLLPGTLSCAVEPASINLNEAVAIALTNTAEQKVDLLQTIRVGDEIIESNLTFNGEIYVTAEGGANTFAPTVAGQHTVELRLQAGAAASATCEFLAIDPNKTPTPETPICEEGEESVGAHVAFLIDNSNSNAATDCNNPQQIDEFSGTNLYQCEGETNREKAVLSAFATLKAVADNEADNADAISQVAVASFPTRDQFVDGWKIQGNGFASVTDGRASVSDLLSFTREPFGLTPYGAAMTAADELFKTMSDDGKAKLAVLVTDGEPTDSDPNGVAAQAEALKAMGVEVYTVYVTGATTRDERRATHSAMMDRINISAVQNTGETWYAAGYANFASYIQTLIGGNGATALVDKVSNRVIEVENSEALEAAFQEIIRTRALTCQEIQ